MPAPEGLRRESARVLLTDGRDRLLLLRFRVDPDDPGSGHGWCTPGGGIEDGESPAEAASRELREETGLSVGPEALGATVAETSGYADLGWAEGVFRDVFFHARVPGGRIDESGLADGERRYHAGHRWWTLAELAATEETVHPFGLAGLVAGLVAGRVPEAPVRLPWHH
ncbi:NUDIX domain-containing protein [Streptomyces sp. NPDC052095]|uniref:NUDIX hydrolase n=1 Tax=unclassified Streptomyces TaxID=2593676 RepID=UPI003450F16A